ncbi:MAG TPA: hypothetical protein VK173_04415 [Lacibacter sp.]|nr:hypothetical protein [Lacibacter sp.]
MDKVLIGQADQEQIGKWKELYKDVFAYVVDGRICYLRSVDRETYAFAATKIATSPAKFTEEVIKKIWLGGDETIRKEDGYYYGLTDFVEELMAKKKGSLEQL